MGPAGPQKSSRSFPGGFSCSLAFRNRIHLSSQKNPIRVVAEPTTGLSPQQPREMRILVLERLRDWVYGDQPRRLSEVVAVFYRVERPIPCWPGELAIIDMVNMPASGNITNAKRAPICTKRTPGTTEGSWATST